MAFLDFLKKKKEDSEILPVIPHEIYEAGVLSLQDVIAPSALQVNSNYIRVGAKVARVLFVMSYPRFLAANWFSPVINLDKVFDISIFIHPVETGSILRQLQKRVAEVQSQIHLREEKGLVRDPVLDTAYQDLENLRDKLQQAQEKLFGIGLYLTIYADEINELNKVEVEIRSILESRLVYIKPAIFQQKEGWESVLQEPEFAERDNVINFTELLKGLEKDMEKLETEEGVNVYIGKECNCAHMEHCSVIVSRYETGDNRQGSLALIGPTRMAYDEVIPLMDYLSEAVTRNIEKF